MKALLRYLPMSLAVREAMRMRALAESHGLETPLLDIGCGDGLFWQVVTREYLEKNEWQLDGLLGIDINRHGLERPAFGSPTRAWISSPLTSRMTCDPYTRRVARSLQDGHGQLLAGARPELTAHWPIPAFCAGTATATFIFLCRSPTGLTASRRGSSSAGSAPAWRESTAGCSTVSSSTIICTRRMCGSTCSKARASETSRSSGWVRKPPAGSSSTG